MAGRYTNGSGNHHDDDPDGKVTSLDAARRQAKQRARDAEKASQRLDRMPSSTRDRILGALFILMALGMLSYWAYGLLKWWR